MIVLKRIVIGIAIVAMLLVGLLLLLGYLSTIPERSQVRVRDVVVTLPAVRGRPGAAYFTLHAMHDSSRLIGISSPRIGRIELHESATERGLSVMRPVRDVYLGESPVRFAPGSRHAMLFDIDPSVRAGERIPLTFTFDPALPRTVEAEVRGPGGMHAGH